MQCLPIMFVLLGIGSVELLRLSFWKWNSPELFFLKIVPKKIPGFITYSELSSPYLKWGS